MQGFEPWLNRPLSIQVHLPTLNSQQNLQPTRGSQDSAPRCRTAIIQAVEIETQDRNKPVLLSETTCLGQGACCSLETSSAGSNLSWSLPSRMTELGTARPSFKNHC